MVWFQKLTRKLFLTLYGHNLHRQQRQLSKFLMRWSQSFNVCTLGHTTHLHTVIKFIPDSVYHVRCNGLHYMRYPITKFLEGHGQWLYVNAVFNDPQRKKYLSVSSGERDGQGRRWLSPFAAPWKLAPRPRSKHEKRTAGSAWETWTDATADGVGCACVSWQISC